VRLKGGIEALERTRGGRVLVLAATALELDLLPILYERLREMGPTERLDVLLWCRGGQVGAARRIGLLLHQFTQRLAFIVPDRCESAGTLLVLAGREVAASPIAVFSRVDPQLDSGAPGGPGAIAAEDVRLFAEMAERWFGLAPAEAGADALSTLSANVFPTALTAFYRATLETESVCAELLALGIPDSPAETRASIAAALLRGHHSHTFPLAPFDLARLGLPISGRDADEADRRAESAAEEIAAALRRAIGPRARRSEADGWTDALVATGAGCSLRKRLPGAPGAEWTSGATE